MNSTIIKNIFLKRLSKLLSVLSITHHDKFFTWKDYEIYSKLTATLSSKRKTQAFIANSKK